MNFKEGLKQRLPFGKHEDKTLASVIQNDSGYLNWVEDNLFNELPELCKFLQTYKTEISEYAAKHKKTNKEGYWG